uniref:Uncharacterized protein n=1 Tax=Xiphophorus couchianus TaxID=32473 RepID=A0A3B5MTR0_9TELE
MGPRLHSICDSFQRPSPLVIICCISRGMLPRTKPELQRVLESKNREQLKKTELSLQPRSDLEVKLRRRQQRIQHSELEEKKWREGLKNVPEFVRVRQSLKHVPHSS